MKAKDFKKYEGKEDDLQAATAQFLRVQYPDILAFHTPNGGHRLKSVAAKLKRQGVTPGVPDWLIIKPNGTFSGLAIELKVKGGKLSEHQKNRLEYFKNNGWAVFVAWCLDEFIQIVNDYLNPEKRN